MNNRKEILFLIDQQARTFEIGRQSGWTIGRDPASDLVVNDIKVSRNHAAVCWEDNGFVIRDMNSRNGTFVNNARIDIKTLQNGDIIRTGNTEFLVRIGAQQHLEEEVLNQRRQISALDTHMDIEEEFRVHEGGFSGSLKMLSMVEVIQTILQFGKDGYLQVSDSHEAILAQAWFENGEVIHAQFSPDKGLKAMYRMVKIDAGMFEFRNDIPAPEHTIEQSTMSILLEACRRMDESDRVQ